jgi:dolichol-phosphate mannosyltransferase
MMPQFSMGNRRPPALGRFVPVRFALFGLIGGLGLVVHLVVLWVALNLLAIGFDASQAIATMVAMTSNFVLNKSVHLSRPAAARAQTAARPGDFLPDLRDRGIANVGVASYAFTSSHTWWLAGVAGAVVGSVWNFAMSSVFTWRRR